MVWGVCRRILGNHHDAADAFQAAFLVFVRRAATIRTGVGSWLYGVARRTALKARATRAKRRARERPAAEMPEPAATVADARDELWPLLDREIGRLPEKYRAVLVLCDLEGRSGKEAARELGCPPGTVSSRLSRARAMLAGRLRRHGAAPAAGPLAALLSQDAASGYVPAAVVGSTIRAATWFAAGPATAAAVSRPVAALTEGVMKSMLLTKLKIVSVAVLVGVLCVGAFGRTGPAAKVLPAPAQTTAPAKPAVPKAEPPKAEPPPVDHMLENALKNPYLFFFGEQATSKTDPNAPRSFDLVITSARNVKGEREEVTVRPGTIRIFRADAGVDEFTKQGGWYWKCGGVRGKSQFKAPGALVMVVRLSDGTVQWYSLHLDIRC